jgi:hypothetical protein
MGATGLERPCKTGLFYARGTHRGMHPADTCDQSGTIYLAGIDQRVTVGVGPHEFGLLPDAIADLRPQNALPVP